MLRYVQHGETTKQLELTICKGNGLFLIGRNCLEEIKLNWLEIACGHCIVKSSQSKLEKTLGKYKGVFDTGLGHCNEVKAKLYVKETGP